MIQFGHFKRFTKGNIQKLPADRPVVYEIADSRKDNIYTGVAKKTRGQERLMEHKDKKSEKISGGVWFRTAEVKNMEVARKEEKKIIKTEEPKYNIQNKE